MRLPCAAFSPLLHLFAERNYHERLFCKQSQLGLLPVSLTAYTTIKRKGQIDATTTGRHPGGALRPRLFGPPGRRSLGRSTAACVARLRRAQRLPGRARIRRRGRVGTDRQPAPVPQDVGRGQGAGRPLRGNPGLEVLSLHAQARARRRVQVDAAPARDPRHFDHRARRRHPDRQADGGDHRERR